MQISGPLFEALVSRSLLNLRPPNIGNFQERVPIYRGRLVNAMCWRTYVRLLS